MGINLRKEVLFFFLLLPTCLLAQTKNISGIVTDSLGVAVVGATVKARDANKTVLTDAGGKFQITVPVTATRLVISYTGMKEIELVITDKTNVQITMTATSSENLSEVVVIGYGNRRKTDLTSSVATVNAGDISKSIASSPELALQGRAPGVFVQANSGSPTARPTVRIRGISTFLNAEPLYVVDGVPIFEFGNGDPSGEGSAIFFQRGSLNFFSTINPDDIESISVLKDGSSAAIYGNRAANGVILITTKRGKTGKPKVDVSMSSGVNMLNKQYEVLNGQELAALIAESSAANPTVPVSPANQAILDKYKNDPFNDWQGAITNKSTPFNNVSVRLSGGTENTTYNIGLGYYRNKANITGNEIKRYSLTTNVTSKISKYFEIGLNNRLSYVDAVDKVYLSGVSFNYSQLFSTSPWQKIYGPGGFGGYAPVTDSTGRIYGDATRSNGVALLNYDDVSYGANRNIINGYFQAMPLKGLKLKASVSVDQNSQVQRGWQDVLSFFYFYNSPDANLKGDGTSQGKYEEKGISNTNILYEYSANYTKAVGNHNFDVFAAYSDQSNVFLTRFASNFQNISREKEKRTLTGPKDYVRSQSGRDVLGLISYLGRFSYNYNSTYYLDVSFRRDGSSNFAPENRWGNFGGVSAAWKISNASFMQNLRFINSLKLRGGYGVLGSQASVGSGAYLATLFANGNTSFGNTSNGAGFTYQPFFPISIANRDITWETNKSTSIGLDAGLLNNKLNFSFDYYNRLTDGILQAIQLPLSTGNLFNPTTNVAKVRNSGFEFTIGYQNQVGAFSYFVNANLTTVKNRVIKLNNGTSIHGGGNLEEGKSINYFWGLRSKGIIKSDKDLADYKTILNQFVNPANANLLAKGDVMYDDIDKNDTIDIRDFGPIGKTIPGYYYGFSVGGEFKNFDLSIFFQGVGDVNTVNPARLSGENLGNGLDNRLATVRNRYRSGNTNTDMPRAIAGDPLANNIFSSRFIESGAFLRLKNIQLGYSLPASLLRKTGILNGLRLYISGSNLLTFTKYSGLDPEEQTANSGITTAIPMPKTVTFGLSLNF
jgi:TonB-dependent starch-binding outer membrane protein SusC